MKKLIATTALCFIPLASYATTPTEAANEVLLADTMDEKCQLFFDHFMRYAVREDFYSSEKLISLIDSRDSQLVDYCDKRRSQYL